MEKDDVSNGTIKNYFSCHVSCQLYCHIRLKNNHINSHVSLFIYLKTKTKYWLFSPKSETSPSQSLWPMHLHPLPTLGFLCSLFLIKQCPIPNNKTIVRALTVMKPKKKKNQNHKNRIWIYRHMKVLTQICNGN